jgi:dihydroflavonol-4-reductase
MRYAVTGATGLVGSHVVYSLLLKGEEVVVLQRAQSNKEAILKVFAFYNKNPQVLFDKIIWREVDLLDGSDLYTILPGIDILMHCAATVSFNPRDYKSTVIDNPKITAKVVDAALASKVKKLIHVSSVAALGRKPGQNHLSEENHWIESDKNSNYAIGKQAAEMEVWRAREEGLAVAIVNPTIILGPGNWAQGSAALIKNIAEGFNFYTQGINGFVDVRDVADIMLRLATEDIEGERFVIVAENLTYQNVFAQMAVALGIKGPQIEVKPWMSALAWRWEAVKSYFSGKPPLVTKETARTSLGEYYYKNDKVKESLNYQFRPIKETIKDLASFYQQAQQAQQDQ